jgi:hypothetical protein
LERVVGLGERDTARKTLASGRKHDRQTEKRLKTSQRRQRLAGIDLPKIKVWIALSKPLKYRLYTI